MNYSAIKDFIKDIVNKHGNLIQNNQWDELYEKISPLPIPLIGGFTQILLDSGINPLLYMKEVPTGFLSNADLTNSSYLMDNRPGYFVIPDNIEYINYKAFYEVKGLTDLIIPPSIKKIDSSAFHIDQKINLHITDFTSFMNIDFDHAINPALLKDGNIKVLMYGTDIASSIITSVDGAITTNIDPIKYSPWAQISKRYVSDTTMVNKSYIDAHQYISWDSIDCTSNDINEIKVRD